MLVKDKQFILCLPLSVQGIIVKVCDDRVLESSCNILICHTENVGTQVQMLIYLFEMSRQA